MNWDTADAALCHWSHEHAFERAGAPRGGWASLSDTPENRDAMIGRILIALSVPGIAETGQGADLTAFASKLSVAPATSERDTVPPEVVAPHLEPLAFEPDPYPQTKSTPPPRSRLR
jgi:hypothetical protein